jgi:hypothetical protein
MPTPAVAHAPSIATITSTARMSPYRIDCLGFTVAQSRRGSGSSTVTSYVP